MTKKTYYEKNKKKIFKRVIEWRREQLASGKQKQFNVSGDASTIDEIRRVLDDVQKDLSLSRPEAILVLCEFYEKEQGIRR